MIDRRPQLTAVSALASGADTVFAECPHKLNVPLISIIPFSGFERDFPDPEDHARYRAIRDHAAQEQQLHYSERIDNAYRKSMEWVVFKSNLVIAAWDGHCIGSIGGTWEALALCERLGKPLLHINTTNRTLSLRADGMSRSGPLKQLLTAFAKR